MNRCTVAGPNGPLLLTIPVVGGRDQRAMISDVRMDNSERWQSRHWRTLTSCYNRSPWFDQFRDELESLYQTPMEFLVDWNLATIRWVCDKLSIATAVSLEDHALDHEPGVGSESMPVRRGSAAQAKSEERYPQVFEDRFGFIGGLSVLDRLFCAGPWKTS